jgi:uncharacterized membrane protein YjjB (DUF3815 family)
MTVGLGGDLVLAAVSAWCFGIVYQESRNTALVAAVLSGAGWAASDFLNAVPHLSALPVFAGALVVGGGAELLAVVRREPVPLLVVPAIIPFVPGYLAYRSMVAFIDHQFVVGLERGLSALLTATAIAVGLAVASTVIRPLVQSRRGPKGRLARLERSADD